MILAENGTDQLKFAASLSGSVQQPESLSDLQLLSQIRPVFSQQLLVALLELNLYVFNQTEADQTDHSSRVLFIYSRLDSNLAPVVVLVPSFSHESDPAQEVDLFLFSPQIRIIS